MIHKHMVNDLYPVASTMIRSLGEIAFPRVCVCCGAHLEPAEHHICRLCCRNRFATYEKKEDDAVLPEFILMQEALWSFEKGTLLQDLLHALKFDNLHGIGLDIGYELGSMLCLKYGETFSFFDFYPLLIPVPLHKKRHKERGFNQARAIASGVHMATGWPILGERHVLRKRETAPQTGLSISDREKNIRHAFGFRNLRLTCNRLPIIIDDILTTGATTMELAVECLLAGAEKTAIATVARA